MQAAPNPTLCVGTGGYNVYLRTSSGGRYLCSFKNTYGNPCSNPTALHCSAAICADLAAGFPGYVVEEIVTCLRTHAHAAPAAGADPGRTVRRLRHQRLVPRERPAQGHGPGPFGRDGHGFGQPGRPSWHVGAVQRKRDVHGHGAEGLARCGRTRHRERTGCDQRRGPGKWPTAPIATATPLPTATPVPRHTGLVGSAPPWAKTVAVGTLFARVFLAWLALAQEVTKRWWPIGWRPWRA